MTLLFTSSTKSPRLNLPEMSCDSHMHIFDSNYPLAPGAPSLPDALVDNYREWQSFHGLTRCVVVAPSMYGLDNRCTLDATDKLGNSARCIVTLSEETSHLEIESMHARGARGFRFNLARSTLNSLDSLKVIAEKVAPLGWHLQLWMHPDGLSDVAPILRGLPVPTVLDHMAGFPLYGGQGHVGFKSLLTFLGNEKIWIKLSLATAWPLLQSNRQEISSIAKAFISVAPNRVVWGSDWPHAITTLNGGPYPDDAKKIDILEDWVSSNMQMRSIFVDNPAALYDFPA